MRCAVLCLLAAALLLAKEDTISKAEASEGWILLFDGNELFNWTPSVGNGWKAVDGLLAFEGTGRTLIRTNAPFSDFSLKFEFRGSDFDGAGSAFLRIAKDKPPQESGYEVKLGTGDAKWPAGSIVGVAGSEGFRPSANRWYAMEIRASAGELAVFVDGRQVAQGKDPKSKAGFLGFESRSGAGLQIRHIKLQPTGMQALFNGSDPTGWKRAVPPPPKPGKLSKIFPFGGGKPKEAQWTVKQNALHGENGMGQLESLTTYDDLVLQVEGRTRDRNHKQSPKAGVYLRGDPGQWFSGYLVRVDIAGNGGIAQLDAVPRKNIATTDDFVMETIVASGRHFSVWVNGYPVTDLADPRVESATVQKGAKTVAGPISLAAPGPEVVVDFRTIKAAALPKILGGEPIRAAPAPVPPPPPITTPPPSNPPPNAPTPIVPTPQPPVQQIPVPPVTDPNKEKSARLTRDAILSTDPEQQMKLYEEAVKLDASNMMAVQGYKEAQQRVEQAQAKQRQQAEEHAKNSEQAKNDRAAGEAALDKGRVAFLARDYATASAQLAIADRLLPANPEVQKLRGNLNRTVQLRRFQYLAGGGGGLIVLLGGLALLWKGRGTKYAYLVVTEGLDKGKRFELNQDVTHIGAVAQDGGARNEIVVRDIERMISRFHCEIHKQKDRLYLVDCNSSNGTRLDGRKVPPRTPMPLRKGARLNLGRSCSLRLRYARRRKSS